jgi:CRISPR system Cascade subunit CasE
MLQLDLVRLERNNPRWRQLDPYQAHQLVWKAFPGVARGDRPFLFSVEEHASHHSILVQSSLPGEWSFLDGEASVRSKSFDPRLIPVDVPLQFFLRCNPTVDRRGYRDGKKRRVAVGINPELAFQQMGQATAAPSTAAARAAWRDERLREWFVRQGERHGFQVETCTPGPVVARRIVRIEGSRPQGTPMIFHEVEFTGLIRATDSDAFVRVCADGLGRGRAFGYGLLMVRRT